LPPGFAISRTSIPIWIPVYGAVYIPVPIFVLILLGIAFALWLKYSAKGRELYAVGGNAEAARLSGISERQVTIQVFVMNGLLVGLAAILYATNFTAIQSNVAPGFELTVITATVIGGNIHISFPTQTGFSYQLLYKNNLTDASWTPLGSPITGNNSSQAVNDPTTGTTRFYRVQVQ